MGGFEYGVLPSNHLLMLQQLIREVFIPLADPDSGVTEGGRSVTGDRVGSVQSTRVATDAGLGRTPGSTGPNRRRAEREGRERG